MSRDRIEIDVLVVGAGPSGLATAIRLKQLSPELSVTVVEKAGSIGGHTLSGAVVDPAGLDALLPEWRQESGEADVPVTEDAMVLLSEKSAVRLPNFLMPRRMGNHGNFVVSLANICRWLATKAEALGVDVFPGFSGTELLFDEAGAVCGVATGDMGVKRSGEPASDFQPGIELRARYTVLAEGARGSLSRQVVDHFELAAKAEPQKYGIGLKEVWRVDPGKHRPGAVLHTMGWPLDNRTGGGGFVYHAGDNKVFVGFVVHLNYANPYLSPFEEFQRYKTHPSIRTLLEDGTRLSFGSRAISEGGYQSVPRLAFAGGLLVGDAAGFVNVPRIKGIHNAVHSGIAAAEHLVPALSEGGKGAVIDDFDARWRDGPIGQDLFPVRNVKPLWSRFGTIGGLALGGAEMWCQQLFGRSPLGTMRHGKADHQNLEPAAQHRPIAYPPPDGKLTFDRLSSIYLSGVNHREDQPVHLLVRDAELQEHSEFTEFAGPSSRYCPAGVYEWTMRADKPHLQINAQNCIHCKTCDIKDPNQNITWTPPEGGGGPNYSDT